MTSGVDFTEASVKTAQAALLPAFLLLCPEPLGGFLAAGPSFPNPLSRPPPSGPLPHAPKPRRGWEKHASGTGGTTWGRLQFQAPSCCPAAETQAPTFSEDFPTIWAQEFPGPGAPSGASVSFQMSPPPVGDPLAALSWPRERANPTPPPAAAPPSVPQHRPDGRGRSLSNGVQLPFATGL